jgi:S1-C subfamily serine protease
MKFNAKKILWIVLIIVGVALLSAGSGAVSGWVVADKIADTRIVGGQGFMLPYGTSTGLMGTDTALGVSETSTIRLVPLSMLNVNPRLVPEPILDRQTPVGILYARSKKASSMFTEEEVVSVAVAMTSDGWFVVPKIAVEKSVNLDWYVWHDSKLYEVKRRVSDTATGVVFIKVEASNLSVVSFAKPLANRTGVAVWFEAGPMQLVPSSIASLRKSVYGEPRLSDDLVRRIVATGQVRDNEIGAPIWDSKGSMVGIVEEGDSSRLNVIPASAISGSLQSLISKQKIEHASLGVLSVSTFFVRTLDEELNLPERGEWIYSGNAKIPAILEGSAAQKAGLKIGDVILQVDRDIIDESVDLGDIVLQFVPGAEVTLRVLRDGKEIDVPVTLGTQVTSKEF